MRCYALAGISGIDYCDEAYAVLAPDYFNGRETPVGFDLATLEADLTLVTS